MISPKFCLKFVVRFLCIGILALAPCLGAPVKFAVIGDFGQAGPDQAAVSRLVLGWNPDFVITTGDNNYDKGEAKTIDANIGQYWHSFIYPYRGSYGQGATANRFFPTLGNHDWVAKGARPYLDYFELPGNERYYDFERGPIHFFCVDSDDHEPDGIKANSPQYLWLKEKASTSTAPFKILFFHHPPYATKAEHSATTVMRWPFKDWGINLVLTGHNHVYERLQVDGLTYVINGLGGKSRYDFSKSVAEGSLVRFSADYGAMLITARGANLSAEFVTTKGEVMDSFLVARNPRKR